MLVDLEQVSEFGACDDRVDRAAAAGDGGCVFTAQRLIQGAVRCAPERDDGFGEVRWEIIEVVDGEQPIDVPKALEDDSGCLPRQVQAGQLPNRAAEPLSVRRTF